MRRILILTLLIWPCIYAAAQQYPVQVTPQLLPPYTLQVSEYYSPGAAGAKLNLLLLLRDFNKPTLQVRLRMSIEGQSVSIRTRADAVFTPLTLESGIPRYVDPGDLEQYFNSNKLEFSGMTQQQYETTGKLPEGLYTFCFEVIEVGTNLVVSNKGCAMAWMTLNEPPLLNIPRKAEALIPTTPQNILFQWTPRHMASPTAGYNTEYIFSIVEIPDSSIAPEAAFLSYPPLDIDTVTTTFFHYNDTREPLISGKKYAWRVQAKAKQGLQDLAMFRNNGFSETFWFTYQSNCALPSNIDVNPQGQRVGISWAANPDHLDYKVEYRIKNSAGAAWFDIGNTIPLVSIGDLKHSTTYEYRVGAACEYGKFVFSPLDEFTTNDSLSTSIANCGIDPNLVGTTEPLLQQLNPGDTIKAGDFNVVTTQVTGQAGNFSGRGYVEVSYLANMKIAVQFTNIGVAIDKKLKTGEIETTYDPNEAGLVDIDEFIEEIKGVINDLKALVEWLKDAALGDKQLKENLEKFKAELEKMYDEEMRNEGMALYEQLDSLNNEYISLQEQFVNATTQAEKDAFEEQMNDLKEQKELLSQQLEDYNDKVKNGPRELDPQESEILIAALKSIQDKYTRAYVDSLKQVLSNAESEFDQYIDDQIKSFNAGTTVAEEVEVVYLGATSSEGEVYDSLSTGGQYLTEEMSYNRAQILRAFTRTVSSKEDLSMLAGILKVSNTYYRNYVAAQVQNSVPTAQIIIAVKEAIEDLATYIIQEKIYK